jgi:hypothetical protein
MEIINLLTEKITETRVIFFLKNFSFLKSMKFFKSKIKINLLFIRIQHLIYSRMIDSDDEFLYKYKNFTFLIDSNNENEELFFSSDFILCFNGFSLEKKVKLKSFCSFQI